MERPMHSVDFSGEPPLLDDREEIAQANELWEEVIDYSKNSKDDQVLVSESEPRNKYSDSDSDNSEECDAYHKQVNASGGFDVDIYPHYRGCIVPISDTKKALMEEFIVKAEYAIYEYNREKVTNFKVVGIEKVNRSLGQVCDYYITFLAVDENQLEPTIFEARVGDGLPLGPYLPCFGDYLIVELCRQKSKRNEGYKRSIENGNGIIWGLRGRYFFS